ncbi:FAD-dependent oxidoreductase [Nocardiopsis trehalosi]|uniref:FAD-dependent oxidoreductase n=1 Tax=Nocardiopsis trehalosi TaxID=109329 RepID=UPI0008375552|nr:FAD-dependent oxidoreductase [Nocardiopsis trehalosi]
MRHYDVVVIGGGIIGACAAEAFARAGASVAVVDTGAADGPPTLPVPAVPRPWEWADPGLAAWLGGAAQRAAADADRLGGDTPIAGRAALLCALDRTAARTLAAAGPLPDAAAWLDPDDPAVPAAPRAAGGRLLLTPDAPHLDRDRYLAAARSAATEAGAHWCPDTPVRALHPAGRAGRLRVVTAAGEVAAGRVVVAAGARTARLLPGAPVAARHRVAVHLPGAAAPPWTYADADLLVAAGRHGGVVVAATAGGPVATAPFGGADPAAPGIVPLPSGAPAAPAPPGAAGAGPGAVLVPSAAGADLVRRAADRTGLDLRARSGRAAVTAVAVTPTGRPLIGAVPGLPGVHVAAGYGDHAAAAARRTAEALVGEVLHGDRSAVPDALRPEAAHRRAGGDGPALPVPAPRRRGSPRSGRCAARTTP